MISVCLSVYSIQGVNLNDVRTKFRKLCGYTLKLRLSFFFFHKAIFFFLIPTQNIFCCFAVLSFRLNHKNQKHRKNHRIFSGLLFYVLLCCEA